MSSGHLASLDRLRVQLISFITQSDWAASEMASSSTACFKQRLVTVDIFLSPLKRCRRSSETHNVLIVFFKRSYQHICDEGSFSKQK